MSELNMKLFNTLDEQRSVAFTGRVNILERASRELYGVIILKDGEVIRARYRGVEGVKAFYNVLIETSMNVMVDFIVEPEIISDQQRQIHYPYSVLKSKASDVLKNYLKISHLRPPPHVKIIPRASILEGNLEIKDTEFQVLCALSEWSSVADIYKYCPLLDYEITEALVSLRKKEALTVMGVR